MSRQLLNAAACAALALAAPALGHAQTSRLNALEDRIQALEDQLRESQSIIKAQGEELKAQGGGSDVAAGGNSLDSFLKSVQIGGHVAASYLYSINNPKTNSGTNTFCQFHCNHNEFSLDAAKLEIGRPAAEPGALGFQFDLLYGQNAAILRNLSPQVDRSGNYVKVLASDQDLFVQQAYATYNLNGVEMKLGKFETLLGYEVVDGDGNSNVTLGILNTYGIPFFHTGLLLAGHVGENTSWAAGVVNGFNNTREFGDKKGFLGKLAWSSGPFLASLVSYVGDQGESHNSRHLGTTANPVVVADDKLSTTVLDGILQFQPSDTTKFWLNVDAGRLRLRDKPTGVDHPDWYGAALGVRQQLTDKLYVALRGEYFKDRGGSRLGFLDPSNNFSNDEISVYTATLTFGYQIAPNFQARLEYRRDTADCDDIDCKFFIGRGQVGLTDDTNDLALVELIYSFD